jgi:DNA-binding transcriptional LysR family regulator
MPARLSPGPFPSWDDYRYFLATSEAGSFTKAASDLGVTQSTLSRRIDHLEQQLGVRLFVRSQSGVTLTAEGESILQTAREIEAKILEIQGSLIGSDKRLDGTVRISVTDGLAAYWMTPAIPAFHDRYPGILVAFNCSAEPADAARMETELSFRFREPQEADLIAVRLGALHFVPWASVAYLKRHGLPQGPEDLLSHRLLDHTDYYHDDGDWSSWFALARAAKLIRYRCNSSSAMLNAIKNGVGIGLLPTYVCEFAEGIVPIALDVRTHSNFWLVYHAELRETARVRAVIDWVKSLFDQDAYPWFRDEFHPPKMREEPERSGG